MEDTTDLDRVFEWAHLIIMMEYQSEQAAIVVQPSNEVMLLKEQLSDLTAQVALLTTHKNKCYKQVYHTYSRTFWLFV